MSGIEPAGEADADIFAKIGDLRQCGDIANALLLAQNVYSNAPKSAQAFIELLHCLMAAHRESEGLQLLTQKAKDRQVSDQLLALHIAVLSRLRRFEEAIAIGCDAIKEHPEWRLVWIALGRTFLDSSRPTEALQYIVEARDSTWHDWRGAYWHIVALTRLCRYEEAERIAGELIRRHPTQPRAYLALGEVLIESGHYARAIHCLDHALQIQPSNSQAWSEKIEALRRSRDFLAAAEAAVAATAQCSNSARILVATAWLHSAQDHEDQAVEEVERALVIDPRYPWALRSRIVFLRRARRYQEAHQAATEALQHHPDDPDLYVTIAWLHSAQGNYDQAVASTQQALTVDPRHSWALSSRILLLRMARRYQEAHQAASEALEHHLDDPDLYVA
ncbi:tetratricopeptide repeat protein, partial [Microbispora rosea]